MSFRGARKGWLQAPPGHPAVPLKDKSGPPSQHSGQGPEGVGFWGLSVSQGTGSLATPRPSAVGLLTPLPSSAIFSPGGGGKEMSGMMDRKGQVGSAEEGPQGWRGRGTERRGGGRTEQSRDKDPRRQKIRLRVGNPETKMRGPGRWRERDRERWGGDGAWGQSRFPSRQRETETGKDGERDTQETDKWTDRHTQDRGLCGERNQGGRGGGGRGKGREEGRRAKRGREEQR